MPNLPKMYRVGRFASNPQEERSLNPLPFQREVYPGERMVKWQLKKRRGGKIFSPITRERIERWIDEGRIDESYLVWRTGYPAWKEISETEEFAPLFE
ncbi:hypothetical protein AKJ39_01510 [candidate division MSBL1 archaeon SCGC-AAA259J03]|uniref:GYF domain-containing protein n=1 Tax=candidate division MSBL1 archaeon SCGC-AAA259J03 TaxID=1698269 RepID=A0A656YXB6_9EURY|nr:hypothetical protein AKJ39_01510 [candidate division MSBL1 archaeon SCGC-AAA259J03]